MSMSIHIERFLRFHTHQLDDSVLVSVKIFFSFVYKDILLINKKLQCLWLICVHTYLPYFPHHARGIYSTRLVTYLL